MQTITTATRWPTSFNRIFLQLTLCAGAKVSTVDRLKQAMAEASSSPISLAAVVWRACSGIARTLSRSTPCSSVTGGAVLVIGEKSGLQGEDEDDLATCYAGCSIHSVRLVHRSMANTVKLDASRIVNAITDTGLADTVTRSLGTGGKQLSNPLGVAARFLAQIYDSMPHSGSRLTVLSSALQYVRQLSSVREQQRPKRIDDKVVFDQPESCDSLSIPESCRCDLGVQGNPALSGLGLSGPFNYCG